MLREKKEVLDKFHAAYCGRKGDNIVIYGTGINAQAVVDNSPDYNIVALMDGEKVGGRIWNLPVISKEELLEYNADFIVIVARPALYSVIYARISKFVETNGIPVYDVEGNSIKEFCYVAQKENNYFNVHKNDLIEKIDEFETVSFDIFDTLIMRKTLYPRDVFEMMSCQLEDGLPFDFTSGRIDAERELLHYRVPTINDIYAFLGKQWGLEHRLAEYLKELEIQTEKKVLAVRADMRELFRLCVQKKKKVYLITDMYFTSDILIPIMEDLDISGYDGIFISCEWNCTKENGLFERVREETGCDRWLHIGDNPAADVEAAKEAGLDTFYVMSAVNMFEASLHSRLLVHTGNLYQRVILGLYCYRLFNSPFNLYHSHGKACVGENGGEGYIFIAPLLFNFTLWMSGRLRKEKVDKLLFGARDGYIIQKLYRAVCKKSGKLGTEKIKEIDNHYLLISRRGISMAAVKCEDDIKDMLADYNKEPMTDAWQKLFGIETDIESGGLADYSEYILCKAASEREQYRKYLSQYIIGGERVAFFDFMSKGTCQLKLEQLSGIKILGIYFQKSESTDTRKNELEYMNFCDAGSAFDKNYHIFKFCDFLEMVMSDANPSFWGFSEKGTPVFYEEKRDIAQIRWMERIQGEIMDYCDDFLAILPYWEEEIPFGLCDEIIGMMAKEYSRFPKEYSKMQMYDGYSDSNKKVGEFFDTR